MTLSRSILSRVAAFTAVLLPAILSVQSAERPNVLLIITDDQGYGDFGFTGNPQVKTPVLDRLAAHSVQFLRFYVSPVCAPTRASLLTGRYHLRTGTWGVAKGRDALHPDEVILAEVLRNAGYRTGMFGKWHNGEHHPSIPHARGFDEFVGFRGGHHNQYSDPPLERNGRPIQGTGYIADYLTGEVIRFIQENRAQPFFAYLAYNTPHTPLFPPAEYFKSYKALGLDDYNAAVYAMVSNLDDNIGRLLAALEQLKLGEKTAVVFLTDNGPNGPRFNGGLRGVKASVYEGGCRVPLLVRWPGQLPAGRQIDTIAAHIDVFPTLLELCAVAHRPLRPLDGRSLLPLIRGEPWTERPLFTHAESPATTGPELYPGAIRTQGYNLVNGTELYDLQADPGERKNLAATLPEKAAELRSLYEGWFKDVGSDRAFLTKAIPIGFAAAPSVSLPAPHATLKGGLKYFDQGWPYDWVTNWRRTDDEVSWNIDVVRAGAYAVALQYRCRPEDVGAEMVVEVDGTKLRGTARTASDPTPPKKSPRELGGTNVPPVTWLTLPVGRVTLSKGAKTLTVRAARLAGESAVDLESVVLTRVD